jgi:hypothetical protein
MNTMIENSVKLAVSAVLAVVATTMVAYGFRNVQANYGASFAGTQLAASASQQPTV